MDPRRLLIAATATLLLSGCAVFRPPLAASALSERVSATAGPPSGAAPRVESGTEPVETSAPSSVVGTGPEAEPVTAPAAELVTDRVTLTEPADATAPGERPEPVADHARPWRPAASASVRTGRAAIVAANAAARTPSLEDAFVGGVQVFAWAPGRVYEVWTAPLRVTTLSLAPGETLVAKAAGDTVRWQIGETASGAGAGRTVHVLLKPLERGLETNLVLTTDRRVYLIELRSGSADGFNAAVAWDAGAIAQAPTPEAFDTVPTRIPDPVALPAREPDGRYRIEPQGRKPRWTPTAVFNDGLRTFITFDPDLQVDEAPVLFILAPDGERQMVNYRQVGGLFIVDRVFERAELRLGDRRAQVVRIRRLSGDRS